MGTCASCADPTPARTAPKALDAPKAVASDGVVPISPLETVSNKRFGATNARRGSQALSNKSDFDDPFADISSVGTRGNIAEEDEPIGPLPEGFRSTAVQEEDDNDYSSVDDKDSVSLSGMISSGKYTYVKTKLTEILQVKQHAELLSSRFNLFYNPSLVRAILEVVGAKEFQIQKAINRGELDEDAQKQLSHALEEVRALIASCTNANTLRTTRRVMRRTRTIGSIFVDPDKPLSEGHTESSISEASVQDAAGCIVQRDTAVRLHLLSPKSADPSRIMLPIHRSSTGGLLKPAHLLSACVNEAFLSVLVQIKDDLIKTAQESAGPSLASFVRRRWEAIELLAKKQSDTNMFKDYALFLDECSRGIELYHPASRRFREVRRRIKECTLTLDVMGSNFISE